METGTRVDGDGVRQRCHTQDAEGEGSSSQRAWLPRGLPLHWDTRLRRNRRACVCS